MVEVRKPGRPLSSCPHPNGHRCSCATSSVSTTVAIPRRTQCGCAQSSSSSSHSHAPQAVPGTPIKAEGIVSEPPSPTGRTSYRIAKPAQRHSRKSSLVPEAIQRMDPRNVNVLPSGPYNPYANGVNGNGALAMGSTVATYPTSYNGYGQLVETPSVGQFQFADAPQAYPHFDDPIIAYTPKVNTNPPPAPQAPTELSPTLSVTNGMHGSPNYSTANSGASSSAHHTPNSSVDSTGQDGQGTASAAAAAPAKKSCCGGGGSASSSQSLNMVPPTSTANAQVMTLPTTPSTFGTFVSSAGPASSGNAQGATHFMLPMAYGSVQRPTDQDSWQEKIESYAFNAPVPVGADDNGSADKDQWTAHDCCCGPSCNCLGCAVHPFNQATHEYIASALKSQKQNGVHGSDALGPVQNGQVSEAAPGNTPSDTASPASNNDGLVYSADEYFFFQYQICEGEGNTCPCGDDCQCIGCIIHGNPLPN
jgi:hypothetical protein